MESVIRYTDRLWKALARPPRPRRIAPPPVRGRLAPWAATLTRGGGRQYAVTVAANSGLTLVFEVASVDGFKRSMLAALCAAFDDFNLPLLSLPVEGADIESAAFARLHDPVSASELAEADWTCGTELSCFPDDIRRVQVNLNELPRQNRPPLCVPREAAPRLFAAAAVH